MGWVSGASLAAATSAAGGFCSLAAVTMTGELLADAIRTVKERTDNPFGVNVRADQPHLRRFRLGRGAGTRDRSPSR